MVEAEAKIHTEEDFFLLIHQVVILLLDLERFTLVLYHLQEEDLHLKMELQTLVEELLEMHKEHLEDQVLLMFLNLK